MSGSNARQAEADSADLEAGASVAVDETEGRAKRMGWTPKNEFRGDPNRWMPAEEFLRRGEEEMPILRERNRKLDRQVEGLTTEIGSVRSLMEDMRAAAQKAEKRAYDQARADLAREREAAVQNADTVAFRNADEKIAALDKDQAPPPKPANQNAGQPAIAPEIVDWVGRQPWWNKNQSATALAIAMQAQLERTNPRMSLNDNLAEVEKAVRATYPDEFPASRREAPASVSSSSSAPAPRSGGKLSFDALPVDERAAARKAFEKFRKQMPTYTEKEYLENYDWS